MNERRYLVLRPHNARKAPAFTHDRFDHAPVDSIASITSALSEHLASSYAVVIDGPDWLVTKVVTAYHRALELAAHPLRLVVYQRSALDCIADAVKAPVDARKIAGQLVRFPTKRPRPTLMVPTLRLTSSAESGPCFGFSCGLGHLATIFESRERLDGAGVRAAPAALRDIVQGLSGHDERQTIRFVDRVDKMTPGWMLVSSLPRSYFGIAMDPRRPVYRTGDSPLSLLRQVGKVGRAFHRALSDSTESFEKIHIEATKGYVVDGLFFDPGRPYVLSIVEGPPVHFLYF